MKNKITYISNDEISNKLRPQLVLCEHFSEKLSQDEYAWFTKVNSAFKSTDGIDKLEAQKFTDYFDQHLSHFSNLPK